MNPEPPSTPPSPDPDLRDLLALLRCGAGAAALRAVLQEGSSAREACRRAQAAWGGSAAGAVWLATLARPETASHEGDLAWAQATNHHVIGWHSADYPVLLRNIPSPPAALFVAGDAALPWTAQIAVVGSRRPSAGGRDNARAFARAFGRAGFIVTSGLADGIDTAAHLGAMERSRTIAVLGTGPDVCYPPGNAGLMSAIVANGAIVTEHPPGTPGIRQHFPSRNRLIAGLALATVVIEATERSGALITARMATETGREVFALPGSIHNPTARGCHRLLREGAGLAETPEEIMLAVEPLAAGLAGELRARLGPAAEQASAFAGSAEKSLWRALGHDPVNLDQLLERTGLTVGPLSAMLLAMQLDGKISAEHGRYSRRS